MARLNEFQLIHSIQKSLGVPSRAVHGIGDDTAVLASDRSHYQLFTTDMLVEGVHFLKTTQPKAIGHKALACNISDIAAMGGVPTCAVVSIGLPPRASARFVKDIYAGIAKLARAFNVDIVGGDTVRAERLTINVALLGVVDKKNLILRSGAKVGDKIFVTGPLGGSLKSGRHLRFTPRVKEAQFLIEKFKPTAMMDISDGLAGDLRHILECSKVGAIIEEAKVPCNKGVGLSSALSDGEDFELLFTLSSRTAAKLLQYAPKHRKFCFYEIGQITRSKGLFLRTEQGARQRIIAKGYAHF